MTWNRLARGLSCCSRGQSGLLPKLRGSTAVQPLGPDPRALPGVWHTFGTRRGGLAWPTPPWDELLYGGVAIMIAAPFMFYPFSKTLFLAFDLIFRPPIPEDFKEP